MPGILICNIDGDYRGIARFSSIPDYYENAEIGPDLQEFVEECVDPETQEIIYRLNNITKSLVIADLLTSIGCESEVLLYCDTQTDIRMLGAEFAGYDVVSEMFEDSPLERGLLDEDVNKNKRETFADFFTHTDGSILWEYRNNLNEFVLFDELKPAEEIAEYCTWLTEQNSDLFEGGRNYTVLKVYFVKEQL